ncbi:NAD-dependent epimerase/dehydratase family protein [Candidatus Nitrosotenuis uzonensis]|uniref:GalE-2 UDP-glucose 4-epimerase n=1 Tax=Candidatus Nitrosotenuis uzonensis TaxID=1407055 RepID=A0A812EZJ9_9ARCH|nr:NAD-dependent epimerase/dehydratase family protein [Candidatus Nitrosotenuis uzonensis]CAE6487098.1 GalE-2 UDP-glucose 4-epimerase [Candidatus Nitrosotenuis uzonensis]
MNVVLTGGAGFIGSHLAERLKSHQLRILDDFSIGAKNNLNNITRNNNISIKKCNLVTADLSQHINRDSTIFHLAARSDVRESMVQPKKYFKSNVIAMTNLLEAMRKKDAKYIVFTSSSVVYGQSSNVNAEKSPKTPISIYGLTKLMCESAIETYCNAYGFKGVILRLANIIGPRAPKGILHDIILKFKKNAKQITVLGDGKQTKSYLHVDDCINAILLCQQSLRHQRQPCQVYNVANYDQITVKDVVKFIASEMNITNFEIRYSKYDNSSSGWHGDIPISKMSITKIKKIGWKPRHSCENAVRLTVNQIMNTK